MNKWLNLGWVVVCLWACSSEPYPKGPVDEQGLAHRIHQRHLRYDTLPRSLDGWAAAWPTSWAQWQAAPAESHGSADPPPPFPWARRTYRQAGPLYLSVTIADYAADSAALQHLRQAWPEVSFLARSPHPHHPVDAAYLRHLPHTGGTRLEVMLGARWVLSLQTNHPEGEKQLLMALSHLPVAEL